MKLIRKFLLVSLGFFTLSISVIFSEQMRIIFRGYLFFIPFTGFALSGGLITFLAAKLKDKNKLRSYLLVSGISSSLILVFIILHNLLYAAASYTGLPVFLSKTFLFLEAVFFISAIIIMPVIYIIFSVLFLRADKRSL